ncbi:MAG: hypothetical protein WC633_11390 [Desulfurivibrionaceae bacterium]
MRRTTGYFPLQGRLPNQHGIPALRDLLQAHWKGVPSLTAAMAAGWMKRQG